MKTNTIEETQTINLVNTIEEYIPNSVIDFYDDDNLNKVINDECLAEDEVGYEDLGIIIDGLRVKLNELKDEYNEIDPEETNEQESKQQDIELLEVTIQMIRDIRDNNFEYAN